MADTVHVNLNIDSTLVFSYYSKRNYDEVKSKTSKEIKTAKALLTPTLQPVRDLFATDFFATDWRSMRLAQPLYAHIRIEDFNRRLVGNRFATGLRSISDLSP